MIINEIHTLNNSSFIIIIIITFEFGINLILNEMDIIRNRKSTIMQINFSNNNNSNKRPQNEKL